MKDEKDLPVFEGYAILELLGHRKIAGYVTEVVLFGALMLRVDVPQGDGKTVTQFYSGSTIYCLTPTTAETVKAFAVGRNVAPVERYELNVADGDGFL